MIVPAVIFVDLAALVAAQMVPQWGESLTMAGIVTTVLGWFMFRLEGELKQFRGSNDRLARANLILVIALKQAPESAKDEARAVIKEIDDAQRKP